MSIWGQEGEVLRKNYLYFQNLIENCYRFQKKRFQKVELEDLKSRIDLIDEYIEVVVEFGLELEETQDYLLRLRYSICERDENGK